jgi:nuclear pore complex protein Nup155
MNALRTLKGVGKSGMHGSDNSSGLATAVDPASGSEYINQTDHPT